MKPDPLMSAGRRGLLWLLLLPLMLLGTELAHAAAFRLVFDDTWSRQAALAESGHGYFEALPAIGGAGIALSLVAAALYGRRARLGLRPAAVPALPFALLPPLAFAVQEHLERLVHTGTVSGVAFEPTFLLGLVLQVPFACATYLAARVVLRVAERVGLVGVRRSKLPHVASRLPLPPTAEELRRMSPLASGLSGRGPPQHSFVQTYA
jgi:hypothetical protein